MAEWFMQYLPTLVIGLCLLALVVLVIVKLVKDKKKGKSSCGCGCADCPASSMCHRQSHK